MQSIWFWHWPFGDVDMQSYPLCCLKRVCLLWPVNSLGRILLTFSLLYFVLQGQTCLLLQVFFDFLLLHSNPWWIGYSFFLELVLGGLHRTDQLQLFQHRWLGQRLELLWCWMVCLGNKQIILWFLRLHWSTALQTLLLIIKVIPFHLGILAHSSICNGHLN